MLKRKYSDPVWSTCVLPRTTIAVDNFTARVQAKATVYFLSHFHADHYEGLSSGFKAGIIYCSKVTSNLIKYKFPGIEKKLIKDLDIGSLHCLPIGDDQGSTFNVKLIPANHCPGSVMFYFEGDFGKYLHTGDFRAAPELLKMVDDLQIDRLFVDTTFSNPKWHFASKEVAIAQVLDLIEKEPTHTEIFLDCEMLGTEPILLAVASHFSTKLHVTKQKFLFLENLPQMKDIITLNSNETRFHVVRLPFSNQTPKIGVQFPSHYKVIKPSTQWFGLPHNVAVNIAKHTTIPKYAAGIWHVLYSIHSSHEELFDFITHVAPNYLHPTTECDLTLIER